MPELSKRQREVVDLIFSGVQRPEQIAARLNLKPKTIRHYLDDICDKFGIDGTDGNRIAQIVRRLSRANLPWQEQDCSPMIPQESPFTGGVFMYAPGQQFTDGRQVYVLERFGSDEYGVFAVLEWNDVPKEMQRRYEVPPAMIIRNGDSSHLQAI